VEAAFFDLDKTVIARSSMMAFAPSFRRHGLLSRRSMARGAWTQLVYLRWGAGPRRLARIQQSVLALTAGWSRAAVGELVAADIEAAIDPITHAEAVERILEHRAAGRTVVLVSAAPEEIVEPIGRRLGVDHVIASQAIIDADGRYTGRLARYAYGPAKAALIGDLAAERGIDLEASWAYTDSFTDLPMLEVVGHPVVVNPDRPLRRVARMRGWAVERFDVEGAPKRRRAVAPALAVAAVTGAVTAWVVLRRLPRTA
jgi:HAD superfamily hydrolase (TIGR01490 family)